MRSFWRGEESASDLERMIQIFRSLRAREATPAIAFFAPHRNHYVNKGGRPDLRAAAELWRGAPRCRRVSNFRRRHGGSARDRRELAKYAIPERPEINLSAQVNLGRITPFRLPSPSLSERQRSSHQSRVVGRRRRSAADEVSGFQRDSTNSRERLERDAMPPPRTRAAESPPAGFRRPWFIPQCQRRRLNRPSTSIPAYAPVLL
ncbi:hypothetical protein VNO77_18868 [Canavalia gladiata]|uniref:Uncharacterized protein n=1 Tax=Canavalia gladiata TaxID=3824 RepID=A0AAN9LLL2_CANGL